MSTLVVKLMISVAQVVPQRQIQSAQVLHIWGQNKETLESRMFKKHKRAGVVVVHCLASRFLVLQTHLRYVLESLYLDMTY